VDPFGPGDDGVLGLGFGIGLRGNLGEAYSYLISQSGEHELQICSTTPSRSTVVRPARCSFSAYCRTIRST